MQGCDLPKLFGGVQATDVHCECSTCHCSALRCTFVYSQNELTVYYKIFFEVTRVTQRTSD